MNSKSPFFTGEIDTLAECNQDVLALHRRFQFQNFKLAMFGSGWYPNTDLGGSLGDFALYAAVAYATVKRQDFSPHTVTVTHVYAYVNYSFTDDPSGPSQYLGHWNRTGVIFVPSHVLLEKFGTSALHRFGQGPVEINAPVLRADPSNPWFEGVDFTVQTGERYTAENIFYPVRNRDFWNWQMQKLRGGNVLSFSDLKLVRLEHPMTFALRAGNA